MNPGYVKDFRGVKVPDARQQTLIKECDFELALDRQALTQFSGRDLQCIGPESMRPESIRQFGGVVHRDRPESSLVPKPKPGRRSLLKVKSEAQMNVIRWIREQNEPRHSRLDDNRLSILQR
jgi:hypothetical protein